MPPLPPRIFLIGFMGAGKSTVARALAHRLGYDFVDTDAWVEEREGRTIEDIFRTDGEGAFREREWQALQAALARPQAVIATGGGLFLAETHQRAIREGGGVSVWLDVPLDVVWERCRGGAERPLFGSREEVERLYEARRERYARADLRIDAGDRAAEDLAAEIAARLGPLGTPESA